MQAQDAQDHDLCLAGFAKRGAGVGAVAPDKFSNDNSGVVESFRASADAPAAMPAIEYHHAAFDHYFITSIADEITKLDNGTFAGWTRTGESFNVYRDAAAGMLRCAASSARRSRPRARTSTRRSRRSAPRASKPATGNSKAVVFAISMPTPPAIARPGRSRSIACTTTARARRPITATRRASAVRSQMLAQGWMPEGYGPLGVIMCSPS